MTDEVYIYQEDKALEVAMLREHIHEMRICLYESQINTLKAMIVATKFRDLFAGLCDKFEHLEK